MAKPFAPAPPELCRHPLPRHSWMRPIYEPRLREVIDHRRAIVRAVAAPGNPANEVIPAGGCEWENFYKLYAAFARQFHQHEIWLHCLCALLARLAYADLSGDRPQI